MLCGLQDLRAQIGAQIRPFHRTFSFGSNEIFKFEIKITLIIEIMASISPKILVNIRKKYGVRLDLGWPLMMHILNSKTIKVTRGY